jgi:Cu/Zn superoxide dismutase
VKIMKLGLAGLGMVGLAIAMGGPVSAGGGNSTVIGQGPDFINPAVSPNPLAKAAIIISASDIGRDQTQITLDATGIDAPPGSRFGAHVHMATCGNSAAASGGHYQNPDGSQPLERQEVWLDFSVNANGRGHAVATRNWQISQLSDRSVVVHALRTDSDTGAAGTRLACTDID